MNFSSDATNDDAVIGIPSIEESRRIVSNALASLSVADRNVVMEDLNAVHHPDRVGTQGNREALIAEHLRTMESWLSSHKNDAYQEAERQSRAYVESMDLRCRFLHSSCYGNRVGAEDAVDASRRLNDFLDFKRRLFGSERILKERLTIKDLDRDDQDSLKAGYWQKIGADVAGRVIVAVFPSLLRYRSHHSLLKAMLVFFSSIFPESSQSGSHESGVVLIYYNTAPAEPEMDHELAESASRLLRALPIKICSHHVALHPQITRSTAVSLPLTIQNQKASSDREHLRQARYVFHLGQSRDDVEVKLRRYGITVDLPCNREGTEIRLEAHRQWIQTVCAREQQDTTVSDAATAAATVASGSSNPSSRSLKSHSSGTTLSFGGESRDRQRTSVNGNSSADAMAKLSAREILHQQFTSDTKTPVSAVAYESGLEFLKTSDTKKREPMPMQPPASMAAALPNASIALMGLPSVAGITMAPTKRQRMDPSFLTDASIILPRDTDILFGRGSGIQNHSGNMQFREILEQHLGSYTTADDTAKRNLVAKLADHMRTNLGMRFLKQAPDGVSWTPVVDKAAVMQKFYQTFRSLRASAKKKQNR